MPISRSTVVSSPASVDATVDSQRALRVRVYVGSVIAIGPGKADLLCAISANGSISAAARVLGMSYKRCWGLVSIMNEHFKAPLVISAKGGPNGGGAALSELGLEVLTCYRAMELRAETSIADDVAHIRSLLRAE